MDTKPLSWAISLVVRRESRINPKPQYQRTPVWSEAKQQLLIDSVLRKYDIPKFYLRPSEPPFEHEVVDGQQRLRAFWDFYKDNFALGDVSKDIPVFGDLSGKKYSELPSNAQDNLDMFELNLVEVRGASDLEIRDLFLRLQEGEALNAAEKRNAMPGNMRDFNEELGETHRVFSLTQIKQHRFAWHDLAALVTCLEVAGGAADVKPPNLKTMYKSHESFDVSGAIAKKVKKLLNYMATVLKSEPPEMNIKWGFVDLYLLISRLDADYVLKDREEDFTNFFISFERERRKVSDPTDLLGAGKSHWDKDMYDYIEAFERSGGAKKI